MKSIKHFLIAGSLCCGAAALLPSCSDLMDTDSEFVEFQEDNKLQNSTDSVYSVMGIIYKMQTIADRTVLLGELRGDLTKTTASATSDLKAIGEFKIDVHNAYNRISDYYAIINNCNYFLANVNKDLVKNDRNVFESEYAVVKAFRAWTYLQVALLYGKVPLITEPLLTEEASQAAMNKTPTDIVGICNYFIDDIKPYVDTKLPTYGRINEQDSRKFFIPVRALLGDLCLWAGRYEEAAQYYHDYLALRTNPVRTGTSKAQWNDYRTKEFRSAYNSFSFESSGNECLCYIPMEINEFYGISSNLDNIFNSTDINMRYAQVMPSKQMYVLSSKPDYCIADVKADQSVDTIYAPKENLQDIKYAGDLRFGTVYENYVSTQERFSRISNERQSIDKFNSDGVTLYRVSMVYLRYAEALNRAGYPQSAFAVLKYGLYPTTVSKYIDEEERTAAAKLIGFDVDNFTEENTMGIHSRGCGWAECDTLYRLPEPLEPKATRADTVNYQIPLVEDMIVNEMALEGAFEGYRFFDLMRVALRRGKPEYLADPISLRNGEVDTNIRSLLMNTENWYLPKP